MFAKRNKIKEDLLAAGYSHNPAAGEYTRAVAGKAGLARITHEDVDVNRGKYRTFVASVAGPIEAALANIVAEDDSFSFTVTNHAVSAATAGESNVGDGTIGSITADNDVETETWTITCTDATTEGAEVWSVVGSVTGAAADATTGVAYTAGPINFTITAGVTAFAEDDEFTLTTTAQSVSAVTASSGLDATLEDLVVDAAAVAETWTITCTDVTTEGEEVWSVVGSVTGALDDATTGVAYSDGVLSFEIAPPPGT